MLTKKTIAVIGATGKMGSAITKNLAKGNYRLLLFANHKEKLEAAADEIRKLNPLAEIDCADCPFDASWEADIIIVAVPYAAEKELAQKIKETAIQKIVVSIANPLNKNYNGLIISSDTSAAEELQKLLPDSKIVKAFNTIFADNFLQPVIGGRKIDSFIAGDDEEAVQTVSDLVQHTGFNPIIAGKLSVSRTLEAMTALLIQLNEKYKYSRLAGWKILHN